MEKQHQLGQHYSKEKELMIPYKNILLNTKKDIVDPFCGEGHLIDFYLSLFSEIEQKDLFLNKKIYGFDIDEKNINFLINKYKNKYSLEENLLKELFILNDSLNNDISTENSFILTNPPYLAKNVCKQKFPQDFHKYFNNPNLNDYFEIAINKYLNKEGIWIVPSNILSSDNMLSTRKKILLNIENIIVWKKKIFDDTDISVCSYYISSNKTNTKNIIFKSNIDKTISFNIFNGSLVEEWEKIKQTKNILKIKQGYINLSKGSEEVKLINENYKEQTFLISEEDKELLQNNILFLRTTDTGTDKGKIGIYTMEELWNTKEAIGLKTKISSRCYTQLFFTNLSIEEQLSLKVLFNDKLNELRNKYDSIFLTNFKNVSNQKQRKRISFKETFSLLNYISIN